MKAVVVDTGVLTLFFAGDGRVAESFAEIERGRATGYVTSLGIAEFHYKTCQKLGRDAADLFCRRLEREFRIVSPDFELSLEAGAEKCKDNDLSLADSFVLALARRGGTVLTTDSRLAKRAANVKLFSVTTPRSSSP